jgi:hypothetical protein
MYELPPKITKGFLLNKKPAEAYFEFYLGVPVKKGLFKSPSCLRIDNHPTCAFYKNANGDLLYKDFAGISGDFIKVVMEIFKVSYYKALNIIANDFGYIKSENYQVNLPKREYSGSILKETERAKILVEIQEFSERELSWWNSFGISLNTLKKFKVYSIKHVFLNGVYFTSSTDKCPIYGYYGGKNSDNIELWRLYMPTKRSYRFISNWSGNHWHGSAQLPINKNHCIIIKSMKDLMLLYEFGFTSIAPTSENVLITESQFSKLQNKYQNILLFFDNDLPGVKAAQKYKKAYGIRCIFIKRKYSKDISDLYKKVSSAVFWTIVDELNSIILDNNIKKTKHFYVF